MAKTLITIMAFILWITAVLGSTDRPILSGYRNHTMIGGRNSIGVRVTDSIEECVQYCKRTVRCVVVTRDASTKLCYPMDSSNIFLGPRFPNSESQNVMAVRLNAPQIWLDNMDYVGGDLPNEDGVPYSADKFNGSGLVACAEACMIHPRCNVAVYQPGGQCRLKSLTKSAMRQVPSTGYSAFVLDY